MRIVLLGASNLAMTTVRELLKGGHEVVVIDKDADVIESLDSDFDCSFFCGDGAKPSVLEEVDPASTDALLCLSDDDTSNVLAAVVAKTMEFDKVLLRLEDPDLLSICEQLGLENVIIPDRSISRQLVAFAEGEGDAPE